MSAGAPYAPFMEPRTARPPGLSPLDPSAWVVCDPDYAAQMAERDALILGGAPDVIAAQPEADAAVVELAEALLAHLAGRPEWRIGEREARRPDGVGVDLDGGALAIIGRLVQEDFLLLLGGGAEHRLVAGVLCFPSRWSLSEKLGRALTPIHGPVPGYAEGLAGRVNRVFAALDPARPVTRINWLVARSPALRQAAREGEPRPPVAEGAGFWLRTERQTLRRLPRTRAVAFGIKTTVTPVEALTTAQRVGLASALAHWSRAEIDYRGGVANHEATLAALRVPPSTGA